MNTIQVKSKLHALIDGIEDNAVLNTVYAFLARLSKKQDDVDSWDELSSEQQADIEEALAELAQGKGVSHKQVMKEQKAKYGL